MAKIVCSACGKAEGVFSAGFRHFGGKPLCKKCLPIAIKQATDQIVATTTHTIDGFSVARYVSIESVEVVIGTGIFSEFSGDFADFFGGRSTDFEIKMQNAKTMGLQKLKLIAIDKGANAILGVDLDYTEFSGNRVGIITSGTLVSVVPSVQGPAGRSREDTPVTGL